MQLIKRGKILFWAACQSEFEYGMWLQSQTADISPGGGVQTLWHVRHVSGGHYSSISEGQASEWRRESEIKTNGGQWKSSKKVGPIRALRLTISDQSKLLVPASFIAFFPVDFPQRAWWNLKLEFHSDLMNWENTFTQIELSTVTGRLFHAYIEGWQWLR